MFPPGSRFKHYWDYAMVCLVLYNCILTPMQVSLILCSEPWIRSHVRSINRVFPQLGYFQGPIFIEASTVFVSVDACIWLLFAGG